jgi:hypothetical protein
MKDVYKKFSTEKSTMDNYYITTESVCVHMYVHLHISGDFTLSSYTCLCLTSRISRQIIQLSYYVTIVKSIDYKFLYAIPRK